ncbi:MAG: hypothetical protein QXH42_05415 [Thermoplasmata archaeon]
MPSVLRGSLEERILELALQRYPATAAALARELGLSERRLMMELRRMASRGLVELDILPDEVFVRPLALLGKRKGSECKDKKGRGDGKGAPPGYA